MKYLNILSKNNCLFVIADFKEQELKNKNMKEVNI